MENEQPAVFQATYHQARPVMGRKVLQIILEVPIEQQNAALAVLGGVMGDINKSEWFAVAKIDAKAANLRNQHREEQKTTMGSQKTRSFAQRLYMEVLSNPNVCKAFGTDAEFQDWVRRQPSCINGDTYDIVYAHVRRANNSGTAMKPEFSGVPLTDKQHRMQHQSGEKSLLASFDPSDAKEWFDAKAADYRRKWCREKLLSHFSDFDRLRDIPPGLIKELFNQRGIVVYLNGLE